MNKVSLFILYSTLKTTLLLAPTNQQLSLAQAQSAYNTLKKTQGDQTTQSNSQVLEKKGMRFYNQQTIDPIIQSLFTIISKQQERLYLQETYQFDAQEQHAWDIARHTNQSVKIFKMHKKLNQVIQQLDLEKNARITAEAICQYKLLPCPLLADKRSKLLEKVDWNLEKQARRKAHSKL